jgi:hypothetical protein
MKNGYSIIIGLAVTGISPLSFAGSDVNIIQVPADSALIDDNEASIVTTDNDDSGSADYQEEILSNPQTNEHARMKAATEGNKYDNNSVRNSGGNVATVIQSGKSNKSSITQKGDGNYAEQTQKGDSNDIHLEQSGDNNRSVEKQIGHRKHKVIIQNGKKHEETIIEQTGDY